MHVKKMILEFRPHHFMCTLGFRGMGYNEEFVENYKSVATQLSENPNTRIRVVCKDDVICSKCPNLGQSGLCKSQSKIEHIDSLHMQALELQNNQILTWNEAKNRIKRHISMEVFHTICNACEWKKLDVCENALQELKNEKQ